MFGAETVKDTEELIEYYGPKKDQIKDIVEKSGALLKAQFRFPDYSISPYFFKFRKIIESPYSKEWFKIVNQSFSKSGETLIATENDSYLLMYPLSQQWETHRAVLAVNVYRHPRVPFCEATADLIGGNASLVVGSHYPKNLLFQLNSLATSCNYKVLQVYMGMDLFPEETIKFQKATKVPVQKLMEAKWEMRKENRYQIEFSTTAAFFATEVGL